MGQIFSLSACLVDEQWRGKNNHVANGPSLSPSLSSLRFPLSYPLPHSRLLPLIPGDTLPLLLPSPSLFPFLTHPLSLFLSFPFLSLLPYSDFPLSLFLFLLFLLAYYKWGRERIWISIFLFFSSNFNRASYKYAIYFMNS